MNNVLNTILSFPEEEISTFHFCKTFFFNSLLHHCLCFSKVNYTHRATAPTLEEDAFFETYEVQVFSISLAGNSLPRSVNHTGAKLGKEATHLIEISWEIHLHDTKDILRCKGIEFHLENS